MALVTYVPRLLPLLFLTAKTLPPIVNKWLGYVPTAVLAAMLFPSIIIKDKEVALGIDNLFLLAAIPAILVAWKTRSLFGTVITGMIMVATGRYFFSF